MKIRISSGLRPLKIAGIVLIVILQTTGSGKLMAQVWIGTTLELNDATLGGNGDYTAFYRVDPYGDFTQLRLRMGDEQTSLFEIGYNFYQNGQWIQNFSLDGDGNGYFKGNLGIGTAATQRLDVLGRMKFRSYSGSSAGAWYTDEAGNQAAFLGMLGPASSDALGVWHGNAWRLNVDQNGKVGIGTTTPAYRVSVQENGQTFSINPHSNGIDLHSTGNLAPHFQTDFSVYTGNIGSGALKFRIDGSGNVGIGTTTARGKFDVDGPGDIYLSDDVNTGTTQSLFIPGHIYISPYNGGNTSYVQARRFDNSGSTSLRFRTYNNGSLTESMHIEGNGNVGIGTTNPDYKLTVKGKIHAEEVKVDLSVPGPDYVFEPDYHLTPLQELKSYINEHKHLPEIPSANQMEEDGINLMELNVLLLKKVEELTLYVIKQQEEIEKLKSKHDKN